MKIKYCIYPYVPLCRIVAASASACLCVCVRPVLPALPAWTCPLVSLDMANLVLLLLLRRLPLLYPPATTTFCGLLSEPSAAARRVANISGHRVTVTNHQRNPYPLTPPLPLPLPLPHVMSRYPPPWHSFFLHCHNKYKCTGNAHSCC